MIYPRHIASINRLRGVAILQVVVSHFFSYSDTFVPILYGHDLSIGLIMRFLFISIFCNGYFGVILFFVLSGFCIHWSHLHANDFRWADFYLRRTFRIYPAYLVYLAVFAAANSASVWDTCAHILLIHNFSTNTFYSINAPFWSIALEWQIYLLCPLIFNACKRMHPRTILTAAALLGMGAWLMGTSAASHHLQLNWISFFSRLPVTLLFPWMLGYYLAGLLRAGKLPHYGSLIFVFLLLIALFVEYCLPLHISRMLVWSMVAFAISVMLISVSDAFPRKFNWIIERLGIVSYSVYLSHDLTRWLYNLIGRRVELPRNSISAGLLATSVCLPIAALVGYGSYRLLEIGGVKLGSRIRRRFVEPC